MTVSLPVFESLPDVVVSLLRRLFHRRPSCPWEYERLATVEEWTRLFAQTEMRKAA